MDSALTFEQYQSPYQGGSALWNVKWAMSEAIRLREEAAKCRRQAEVATDLLTMGRLTTLAKDYDAKAKKDRRNGIVSKKIDKGRLPSCPHFAVQVFRAMLAMALKGKK